MGRLSLLSIKSYLFVLATTGLFASSFPVGLGAETGSNSSPTLTLQGSAKVEEEITRDKNLEAWQASQAYKLGAMSLDAGNIPFACEWFRISGDGFEGALGECKFVASARFAEGQSRLLLKQNAKAAELFRIAIDLFKKYDPASPYLKAAVAALDRLPKGKALKGKVEEKGPDLKLTALPGQIAKVGPTVQLRGNLTEFEDGTLIASLKEDQIFAGGKKRLLSQAAALDLSDEYVKKTVYKAFVHMTCLETAALGGNYETANRNYRTLKANGKSVAVGAADDLTTPVATMFLNGQWYPVPMDLPGISKSSRNVLLVTDGMHVLAIDPRTDDTWKLIATFFKKRPDFNWWKLTHKKTKS